MAASRGPQVRGVYGEVRVHRYGRGPQVRGVYGEVQVGDVYTGRRCVRSWTTGRRCVHR